MSNQDPYFDDEVRGRRTEDADVWRERGRRLWRWLTSRPAESWMFFVAGVLAGNVLL